MSRCGKYEDIIARFIHGGVLLPEREDLERHLAMCLSCERLYRETTEADRLLREIPEKLVEPPPYLKTRILGSLPEPEAVSSWWGWGRRTAMVGGAVACALLAFVVYRAAVPRETRVASLPGPRGEAVSSAPREPARPEVDASRAGTTSPAPEAASASTGSRDAAEPSPSSSKAGPPPPTVAAVPKVQVIREVRIYFYCPPARNVAVTGDFNGWDAKGVPLKRAGRPGLWTANLRLKPGAYSYNFIVDGEVLVPDPNASNQAPDGYGGMNSILLVKDKSA